MRTPTLLALVLGLVLLADGCLSKTETPPPRYFRPGPVLGEVAATATDTAILPGGAHRLLRVREVTAAAHLHERMVWADPSGEYGFYEGARWTEPPAAYVEAALARALFEEGRFRRSASGDAPILDVHVAAFEEVVGSGGQTEGVRVALRVVLATREGHALLERTFAVTRPAVASQDGAAVARATGAAMEQAIREAADALVQAYPR